MCLIDCHPSSNATQFQGYVTNQTENHPLANGNGETTLNFFNKAFGMNGREALALMGAHTVSSYNTIIVSDNEYSWLRDRQMELFNNKYYKVMAERKSKLYDQCVGTMDNKAATAEWRARTNIFTSVMKKQIPWATSDNPGHLRWDLNYVRGPSCVEKTKG